MNTVDQFCIVRNQLERGRISYTDIVKLYDVSPLQYVDKYREHIVTKIKRMESFYVNPEDSRNRKPIEDFYLQATHKRCQDIGYINKRTARHALILPGIPIHLTVTSDQGCRYRYVEGENIVNLDIIQEDWLTSSESYHFEGQLNQLQQIKTLKRLKTEFMYLSETERFFQGTQSNIEHLNIERSMPTGNSQQHVLLLPRGESFKVSCLKTLRIRSYQIGNYPDLDKMPALKQVKFVETWIDVNQMKTVSDKYPNIRFICERNPGNCSYDSDFGLIE